MKNNIEKEWKDLIHTASNTYDTMGQGQTEKKVDLVEAIKKFRVDVAKFRVA